ncbi:hypothetical protein FOQG_04359 [Fusarium oxysporum f. sp. raphani 54005]|uniref:Uncharacterized protein n=1 Tax=Fusarium oxysporum f. sp. raphani 54005 TaxID=1089458 RepID=X0DIJ0_FUSOX|nr:hypothetical protein FOQG_04359 [Fusarium oxysporum f. sp. raphani 54005]EXK94193.1 hypothetical protein FOQG_04359 [Fusarium oxysporum f. sp. raphani 54005]
MIFHSSLPFLIYGSWVGIAKVCFNKGCPLGPGIRGGISSFSDSYSRSPRTALFYQSVSMVSPCFVGSQRSSYQTEPMGAALCAIQASRCVPRELPRSIYRFEVIQLILCRSSSSFLVALVKSQPLAQHTSRLRQWAFPPCSILCVLCLVARHIVKLNNPILDFGIGILPLPSHSSAILVNHNISIGEAGPGYGARKQMRNRDD